MYFNRYLLRPLWSIHRSNSSYPRIFGSNLDLIHDARYYSKEVPKKQSFIGRILSNVQEEMTKNKELKQSLKKFREEADKLEHSEALQAARQKFHTVESEASKSSELLKGKLGIIKEKMEEVLEEAKKTDIAKKAGQFTEDIGKTVSEKGEQIGKSGAFQSISQATEAVKKEINVQGIQGRVYQSPVRLRKRKEIELTVDDKIYEPNLNATGVELHKDSKFYQSWQNFKDNNPYVNKVLDWKIKYDESENPVIRASRALTNKVSDIMGGLFQKTELSETLTEICKLDPNFDQKRFLRECETDIIPNILEAMVRGDLEVLKSWCHEGPYNVFAVPLKQAKEQGYKLDSKILDIDNVDLAMGKVMDQGPVLIITFHSQQIMCVRDKNNNIVEGNPEKVMRVNYVWVLCRDPTEINPKAAWRLLDLSAQSNEQLV